MLFAEQLLNGIQFGATLFLVGAGLTLVFGIMNLINLAHGSLYMVGAYVSAAVYLSTGSFLMATVVAMAAALLIGLCIEVLLFRHLYHSNHLDQVLVTFGLIMCFNEVARIIWGPGAIDAPIPAIVAGSVQLLPGMYYPIFRLVIIGVALATGMTLYWLISWTRLGMLIRAGASDRNMVGALGVNILLLNTLVFAMGASLAAVAGALAGPIFSVQPGMGDDVLVIAFVVIIVGGVGSVRGAFLGAMLIGITDTLTRAFLRPLLQWAMGSASADAAVPAIASMSIYLTMAIVLFVMPQGLFPGRSR